MELKLELLEYQEVAIKSIVNVFEGNDKNTFDNACTDGIRSNICTLSNKQLTDNINSILIQKIENHEHFVKNPPQYINQASSIIRNIEMEEMLRGLDYHLTNESFPFEFEEYVRNVDDKNYVDTPKRGVFDKMIIDSTIERNFALATDSDDEVICFLKLPAYYKIPTPIGEYNPDFGIVMKRKSLRDGKESEFYFVIETKGTNDINDKKALKESEIYKIKCALKHCKTLGVEVQYKAPIQHYQVFKDDAINTINALIEKS
jgi:type III restriction enzyme